MNVRRSASLAVMRLRNFMNCGHLARRLARTVVEVARVVFLTSAGPQVDGAVLDIEKPRIGVEVLVFDGEQAFRQVEHAVERALGQRLRCELAASGPRSILIEVLRFIGNPSGCLLGELGYPKKNVRAPLFAIEHQPAAAGGMNNFVPESAARTAQRCRNRVSPRLASLAAS